MTRDIAAQSRLLNRWPARLDVIQGASGLLLVLFMWAHMLLVSSILLGHDAMYTVARFFEGQYIFGKPYPQLVSVAVASIAALIVLHALLAMRKFPGSYREYRAFHRHMGSMRHSDTTLWYLQLITGFSMFFLASVHLYTLFTHPADIGPYASADRVWSGMMWPLYLVLLFAVELHGGIGLYRLIVKWGWFPGRDGKRNRRVLKGIKWIITAFFLILGLLTLAAYMKIGIEHSDRAGERYVPEYLQSIEPVIVE
jgi:fumarate reductase subunit C